MRSCAFLVSFTWAIISVAADVNPVTDIDLTVNEVAENAAAGTYVGITALAADPAPGDTVNYTFSVGENPGGLFAIEVTTSAIASAGVLDYIITSSLDTINNESDFITTALDAMSRRRVPSPIMIRPKV